MKKIFGSEIHVNQMACSSCGHICKDILPGYPNGCVQCSGGVDGSFLCSWCYFMLQDHTHFNNCFTEVGNSKLKGGDPIV